MSVYDRCSLVRGDETQPALAPSVLLTPKIPTHIPFKLCPEPPLSLLSGYNCLHVAYSWSIDDRWISVAWSDQLGGRQISASFCFARREESEPRRPFRDVADEVWVRSLRLMQDQKAPWQLMIVKTGAMETEEVEGSSQHIAEPASFSGSLRASGALIGGTLSYSMDPKLLSTYISTGRLDSDICGSITAAALTYSDQPLDEWLSPGRWRIQHAGCHPRVQSPSSAWI